MAETLPLPAGTGAAQMHEFARGGFAWHQAAAASAPDTGIEPAIVRAPHLAVVCAAELYNAGALRQALGDLLAPDAGDAAIIAALYRRYGLQCVQHLRGAFSFALWDAQEERLLLATDAFAIQPLHYYCGADGLVFGSRIAPILDGPATPRRIDPQAVFHYFYFSCVPTPHTIYADIKKLPPGHFLTFSTAGMELVQYWDIAYADEARPLSE
jgi:asparagine synthase (glutamine-hydrolysing)